MSAQRILVVDDEANIRRVVVTYLKREGYDVAEAVDGEKALDAFGRSDPDLVILDVMMPGIDGIETLRRIRRVSDVPVIMLTARAEETDELIGLSVGADDYVTKPFSAKALVARAKAVLRRSSAATTLVAADSDVLAVGELVVDVGRHEVLVGGESVVLTALEFELLAALASAPGRVFSRRQLLERVWGWDHVGDQRVVDVHIRKLRRALGDDAGHPRFVETVRGVGYRAVDRR